MQNVTGVARLESSSRELWVICARLETRFKCATWATLCFLGTDLRTASSILAHWVLVRHCACLPAFGPNSHYYQWSGLALAAPHVHHAPNALQKVRNADKSESYTPKDKLTLSLHGVLRKSQRLFSSALLVFSEFLPSPTRSDSWSLWITALHDESHF